MSQSLQPVLTFLFCTFCLLLTSISAKGAGLPQDNSTSTITLSQSHIDLDLNNQYVWLKDEDGQFTIDDIQQPNRSWQQSPGGTMSFGFTESTYWFKTILENKTDKTMSLYFDVPNPLTDWITFYSIGKDSNKMIQTGDTIEFSNRPIEHTNFIFPIELEPGERTTYLFQVRDTDEFIFSLYLWDKDSYVTQTQTDMLIHGIFYGVMMIMAVYNFIILLMTRQKAYMYYVGFVIFTTLFIAVQHGYAFQYLWPTAINWNGYSDPVSVLVASILGYLFTREVLQLKEKVPKVHKFFDYLIPINIATGCSFIFLPLQASIIAAIIVAVPGAITCISTGFYLALKGDSIGRFYSIAWFSIIVGVIIAALKSFGIVEYNAFTANSMVIGALLEVSLLSLTLASQIGRLEKEKMAATSESKAKSEFLAKMSHEIRTPMNGVIGMAELLRITTLSKTQKHYADVIHSSGSALLSIINDILDYSKIEAGKMELERTSFNVKELIENTLAIFGAKANEKRVELLYQIEEGMPLMLDGDPARLKQILINLIGNALKFTDDGEILIKVTYADADQAMVKFSIKDTGIGISQEAQDKLFTAFSQADASIARRFGGTGLGLAISKQLTALMKGEVGVDSKLNQGSTFWFTACLYPSSIEAQEPNVEELKNRHVLIIDDNESFCDVMATMCQSFGMHTETAYSAEQALHVLSKRKSEDQDFDLVSLDLYMPITNGLTLARQIRERNLSQAQFILVSSSPEAPEKDELEELNIQYRLEKPVLSQNLLDVFCQALGLTNKSNLEPSDDVSANSIALHILVAEDNKTNQVVISSLLKKLGHSFIIANNGQEAVDQLKMMGDEFDLVLMDCEMPEMDGWEATSVIRSWDTETGRIPIIAATAHAVPELINRCLSNGMNETICKPIRILDLKKLLSHYPKRKTVLSTKRAG